VGDVIDRQRAGIYPSIIEGGFRGFDRVPTVESLENVSSLN